MKISIRYKLLSYMLVSVIMYVLLLFISNQYFVEKYYLEKNKTVLLTSSQQILKVMDEMTYNQWEESLSLNEEDMQELMSLERQRGQNIAIWSSTGARFYPFYTMNVVGASESNRSQTAFSGRLGDVVLQNGTILEYSDSVVSVDSAESGIVIKQEEYDKQKNQYRQKNETDTSSKTTAMTIPADTLSFGSTYEIISQEEDGSFFARTEDDSRKFTTLQYQTKHDNGLFLTISMPMSIISEGVEISTRFSTVIGIITMFITIIWAFFISHKFTKPIKIMSHVTSKMAKLDFTDSIELSGADEVTQLSENINILSKTLDDTICELNRNNQRLAEDIDKERKIDKMRRDFMSNVSHELKTPIFLIQGYADGLKSNISKDQEKKDFYCNVIIEEADKMNMMVKDLLALARMESGQTELDKSNFNLYEMVHTIAEKYKMTFNEKSIEVKLPEPSHTIVYADAFKIEQVITNFINNALEYVDGKREITIEIANILPHKVRFSVSNTGKHIETDHMDMIWYNFYKVDESRNREIGGAGLGLSIVKATLEAHHCDYGVRNTEDGVEFWFEIELADS